MTTMALCAVEAFTSPVWESNLVVFTGSTGEPVPEPSAKEYISRCCKYAKLHQVYLVPELFSLMGYRCMCLISPEGIVLGAQRCIYWNTDIKGGKRSASLNVISTEFGGIFLCVDVDVYRPEVARIACSMGAQIMICSQQISMADYNGGMVVTGVWSASQSNHLYTVGVSNAFACVCAPRVMTRGNDGFFITPSLKIPMSVKLAGEAILQLPQRFCLNRKFYAVHRSELVGGSG